MAPTTAIQQTLRGVGAEDYRVIKFTGDTSYPTGGYVITPAMFGFNSFATDGQGTGLPPTVGAYNIFADMVIVNYGIINPANGNLQIIVTSTNLEIANTTTAVTYSTLLGAFGH